MINDDDYNKAKVILMDAGSKTARCSHGAHTKRDGVQESYCKQLLKESRDEFIKTDLNKPNLHLGMTQAHYNALSKAAEKMNINLDLIL